jgi:predicted Zn-dependent peptidase
VLLACPGAATGGELVIPVKRHELANGLEVLTIEDHSVPVMTYYTFYHVGSRNERPGITGLSHYFEHMMFNGAEQYGPKEFDRMLESNGGYSNAFTSNDMTAYYEDFPSDKLEVVLALEADRMRSLKFDPTVMESERGVVTEERRLGVDNDPAGSVDEIMYATAFVAHPYQWPVIGWMADIQNYTREDCLKYFETYYAPNNATVILAGDFESEEALQLLEQYLGGLPRGPEPLSVVRSEPPQRGERRAAIEMEAQVPIVAVGYHVPPVDSADALILNLFRTLLVSGESSRLQESLVFDKEIAIDVNVDYWLRVDPNLFCISVDVNPDSSTVAAEGYLLAEIARLAAEPPDAKELEKAKNKLLAGFYRDLKTNNGRATEVGAHNLVFGDHMRLFNLPEFYQSITAADIQRVAAAYFTPQNRTVVTLIPKGAEGES